MRNFNSQRFLKTVFKFFAFFSFTVVGNVFGLRGDLVISCV